MIGLFSPAGSLTQMVPDRLSSPRFAITGVAALAITLTLPLPGAQGQEVLHGKILGQVVEQESGDPVQGVGVRLRGLDLLRITDSRGRFEFEAVPPGPRVLETAHLSYRVRTDSIVVPPEETLEVRLTMSPDPIPLEPILVSIRSKVLEASGFFRRREQGLSGILLTREQILERDPRRLTDLFLSMPGVRMANRDGVVGPVVVFPRGNLLDEGSDTCYPSVWIDGVLTTLIDLDQIPPETVEGLEVYQGAGAPLRFSTHCGAIIIWTHIPVKRGGTPGTPLGSDGFQAT